MILPVLEERFGLRYHRDMRELSYYALVVNKGGVKLKPATPGDTYANGLKMPNGTPGGVGLMMMRGSLTAQGVPVASLVDSLAKQQLGHPVLDRTGLTGNYDFRLQWTPDSAPESPGSSSGPAEAGGVSLFTALQKQLGLKLELRKGEVPVVVIDHLERRPTSN